jgi:hypothetical protein
VAEHVQRDEPTRSVVVPAHDSERTLGELLDRIVATMAGSGEPFEVVVVDDGSRDATWDVTLAAAAADPRIVGFRIEPGRGQAVAVSTAMHHVRGDLVAYIDADLEYWPEDLPSIFDALADGADLACGSRRSMAGRTPSRRVLTEMIKRLGPPESRGLVIDPGCGLKGWRLAHYRRAMPSDHLTGGVLQMIPLTMAALRVDNVPVRWRPSGLDSGYDFTSIALLGLEYQLLGRPRLARRLLGVGALAAVGSAAAFGGWPPGSDRPRHTAALALVMAGFSTIVGAATTSLATTALRSTVRPRVTDVVGDLHDGHLLLPPRASASR